VRKNGIYQGVFFTKLITFNGFMYGAWLGLKEAFWACPPLKKKSRLMLGFFHSGGRVVRYKSSLVPRCGLFAATPHALRFARLALPILSIFTSFLPLFAVF
jgi:hypothetical protein